MHKLIIQGTEYNHAIYQQLLHMLSHATHVPGPT